MIQPDELSRALAERLTLYANDVQASVDEAGKQAMNKLVSETRKTAPRGNRRRHFASYITSKTIPGLTGDRYVWCVKAPEYRLTHLLVHGHATTNGGRTQGNTFLRDALAHVLPEYERQIEEAVRK